MHEVQAGALSARVRRVISTDTGSEAVAFPSGIACPSLPSRVDWARIRIVTVAVDGSVRPKA